jgi:hypothetical protein
MTVDDILKKYKNEAVFFKGTEKGDVSGERKVALNRKGNEMFNAGSIEAAKRVFITTGYSDGLSRVGDYYKKQGRKLDALKMYTLAHDKKKVDEVCADVALFIEGLLKENTAGAPRSMEDPSRENHKDAER